MGCTWRIAHTDHLAVLAPLCHLLSLAPYNTVQFIVCLGSRHSDSNIYEKRSQGSYFFIIQFRLMCWELKPLGKEYACTNKTKLGNRTVYMMSYWFGSWSTSQLLGRQPRFSAINEQLIAQRTQLPATTESTLSAVQTDKSQAWHWVLFQPFYDSVLSVHRLPSGIIGD